MTLARDTTAAARRVQVEALRRLARALNRGPRSASRSSVTSQGHLLGRITRLIDDAGIRYMVVGSLASSFHGEPRQTRDIELVIDPQAEALRRFVDRPASRRALRPIPAQPPKRSSGGLRVCR